MMNRKEFQQYLQETIKDYLPESYADANITFNEVVKNNDTHLIGISIAKPGEVIVPNIYIENFWNEYQAGKDIDEIVGDIADMRIEYDAPNIGNDVAATIMNYEAVKDNLQIRLCDTQENQDRLQNLVHTEHSDFSATYHVVIQEGPEGTSSTPVTPLWCARLIGPKYLRSIVYPITSSTSIPTAESWKMLKSVSPDLRWRRQKKRIEMFIYITTCKY